MVLAEIPLSAVNKNFMSSLDLCKFLNIVLSEFKAEYSFHCTLAKQHISWQTFNDFATDWINSKHMIFKYSERNIQSNDAIFVPEQMLRKDESWTDREGNLGFLMEKVEIPSWLSNVSRNSFGSS